MQYSKRSSESSASFDNFYSIQNLGSTFSLFLLNFLRKLAVFAMTWRCQIRKPMHMLTSKFYRINLSIAYTLG